MVTKSELIEILKRAGVAEYIIQSAKNADGNIEYIGKAAPSSTTSESVWQIIKLEYDADQDFEQKLYAEGAKLFDKIWDSRADYTYS